MKNDLPIFRWINLMYAKYVLAFQGNIDKNGLNFSCLVPVILWDKWHKSSTKFVKPINIKETSE